MSYRSAFEGFDVTDGHVWLNTAHQGMLPLGAAEEGREAILWKTRPFELTQERFDGVPQRLRGALAKLIGARPEEIVLSNSASYGLHLLAHAFPWRERDEVVVVEGDFPSNILPWLLAETRYGIRVLRARPRRHVLEPDELEAVITSRTRLVCVSWVHSFSGFATDVEALGGLCRAKEICFVINASQALGARPLDLSRVEADAIVCTGFKWLCGPYGTGFTWLHPALLAKLRPLKAYWLSALTAADLGKDSIDVRLPEGLAARSFDVFGTANFFNFKPFAASVELILRTGLERIVEHDQALVEQFLSELDRRRYHILSPRQPGPERSTLIFFSHHDRERNRDIHRTLTEAGIHVAHRAGLLRLSPHLYNSSDHIASALAVLHEQG